MVGGMDWVCFSEDMDNNYKHFGCQLRHISLLLNVLEKSVENCQVPTLLTRQSTRVSMAPALKRAITAMNS